MAVLGTFEVTVSSEGRTLKEYEVEPDDPAFATDDSTPEEVNMAKYVEAIDGAGFQIKYALGRGLEFAKANYLSCWVYIDGKYMTGDALPRADYQKNQSASGTIIGATIWNGNDLRVMPFQWRELLTTGEPITPTEIKKVYGQMGTITVEIYRMLGASMKGGVKEMPVSHGAIPEKALKGRGLDLGTRLGDAKPRRGSEIWEGTKVDCHPLARFVFHYRSKSALQSLGIIPREPIPIPLEDKDPDALTLDEAKELLRQQKAEREAARVKIKKEKAEETLSQLRRVKREYPDDDEDFSVIASRSKKACRELDIIDLSD